MKVLASKAFPRNEIRSKAMSVVVEKGTIRNAIRGIDEINFHIALFEPIDDRQHSNSHKVFVDLNVHEAAFTIGFENPANENQINNMVRWHTCQEIHTGDGMATAAQGLKIYENLARGEQYHGSYFVDENNVTKYIDSRANTGLIFNAARDPSVSETKFSEIINKNTVYAQTEEEVFPSIANIYKNTDSIYPFAPKTIILSKKITNERLLEHLKVQENINTLRKELRNKYFHEISSGDLELYIKFPFSSSFELLDTTNQGDTIGWTIGENRYITYILEVTTPFKTMNKTTSDQYLSFSKGDYILQIGTKYFVNKKNGNSTIRELVPLNDSEKVNLKHLFNFHQYTIPENLVSLIQETNMVGTSMEIYSGVYLRMGGKFNNSKPMPSTLTTRNLYKSRHYRGVLEVASENADYVKNKLQLNGLKAKFNLSDMSELEYNIKQATTLYKKWAPCTLNDKDTNPEKYACVKTTNEKTKEKEKLQHLYIAAIGKNFYKLGIHTATTNNRIFDYIKDDIIDQNKKDFPNEEIFEHPYINFHTLAPIKNACSVEQRIKELLLELDDVGTYDQKKNGNGIREYFHCEDAETMSQIIQYVNDIVSY